MKNNFWNLLTAAADLDGEPVPGQPLIEVVGRHRVYLENHTGLCMYTDREIRVRVRTGQIAILGSALSVGCISSDSMVITGCIDGLQFCGGGA